MTLARAIETPDSNQVAEAWDRPLYVIRTLSDLAGEESHVTYGQMALMAAQNSALCVAEALPSDGKLWCCDVSEQWTGIARRYWKKAGVESRIELTIADRLYQPAIEACRSGSCFID